jgi:thioredoxin reductase (NADPH)
MALGSNWDCLVVGRGPAALTAALYLAQYRRRVLVVDAGRSRAAQIPETHNHPGFKGIDGKQLLARLAEQATRYGAVVNPGEVTALAREGEEFLARTSAGVYRATLVIMATGLTDHAPELSDLDKPIAEQ